MDCFLDERQEEADALSVSFNGTTSLMEGV